MTARMRLYWKIRVAVGVILLALGIFLTLHSLGIISGDVALLWPLIVVALGLGRLFDPLHRARGLMLLVVGAVLQLSNLGLFVLQPRALVRFWPILLVVAGLVEFLPATRRRDATGGFATFFLGVWFQFSYFGAPHISSYRLWPLILSAIGLALIGRRASGAPTGSATEHLST